MPLLHVCTQWQARKQWAGIKAEEIRIISWCQQYWYSHEQDEISCLEDHSKIIFNTHKESKSFLFWRMSEKMGCVLFIYHLHILHVSRVKQDCLWAFNQIFLCLGFDYTPKNSDEGARNVLLAHLRPPRSGITFYVLPKTFGMKS